MRYFRIEREAEQRRGLIRRLLGLRPKKKWETASILETDLDVRSYEFLEALYNGQIKCFLPGTEDFERHESTALVIRVS